jgi:hypothetical protein
MAFLPIFVSIVGIATLTAIAIYYLSKNKAINPLDVKPNATIYHNYSRMQFTDNGINLIEAKMKPNKNGTHTLYCYRMDEYQGEDAPKPKLYKFVINNTNLRVISPHGSPRKIVQIISKNITDYPPELRKTMETKGMVQQAILNHTDETFGEIQKGKDKATRLAMIKMNGGEFSADLIESLSEKSDAIQKNLNRDGNNSEKKE